MIKDDVELQREAKSNTIQIVDGVLANTEVEIHCWVCVAVQEKLLQSCNKGKPTQKEEPNGNVHCDKNQLDMVLIQRAEHQIIRANQRRHFSDEIKLM